MNPEPSKDPDQIAFENRVATALQRKASPKVLAVLQASSRLLASGQARSEEAAVKSAVRLLELASAEVERHEDGLRLEVLIKELKSTKDPKVETMSEFRRDQKCAAEMRENFKVDAPDFPPISSDCDFNPYRSWRVSNSDRIRFATGLVNHSEARARFATLRLENPADEQRKWSLAECVQTRVEIERLAAKAAAKVAAAQAEARSAASKAGWETRKKNAKSAKNAVDTGVAAVRDESGQFKADGRKKRRHPADDPSRRKPEDRRVSRKAKAVHPPN